MSDYSRAVRVRVAEFKANLSKHLRAVQQGEEVTVYDRHTPIAHVVPVTRSRELATRPARSQLSSIRLVPPPAGWEHVDVLGALAEERSER